MSFRSHVGVARCAIVHAATPCLLVALLATPVVAVAAPVEVSLEEAVGRASARAPMLEAGGARLEAARHEAVRAGAWPDPMLTVGIDNWPVTGVDAFDRQADEMTMQKIGLRQEIPASAKRRAQRTLAGRQVDAAQAEVEAERLAIRRGAAEAWLALWASQRELAAVQALRAEAALAARLTRARVAGGSEPVADALAAEVAVLELDNRIAAADAARAEALAGLQRWLGEGEITATLASPELGMLPYSEPELLAALDRLPALRPGGAQLESAAAEVDLARADRRPDWSVAASYGQRGAGRSDMLMLELGVGLPLFTRNRQDRGVAARESEYQAALASREDLRRQQAARLRADFAQWDGLKRQVARDQEALLPLVRDRSATALAAYRAGAELRPWLEARRDELDLQLAHVQRLGDLGRVWAALAFLLEAPQP
jgi:outer membrane protein TolC